MKIQTSITIDEEVISKIKEKLRDGSFRNKSHLFEFAARKFLVEEENKR
jgi:Arc/MetJ-type ribon-helix-helix transcriptional regulator